MVPSIAITSSTHHLSKGQVLSSTVRGAASNLEFIDVISRHCSLLPSAMLGLGELVLVDTLRKEDVLPFPVVTKPSHHSSKEVFSHLSLHFRRQNKI